MDNKVIRYINYNHDLAIKNLMKVIDIVGNQVKLANLLCISPQNISNWISGTHAIPVKHVNKISKLSAGKIKMRDLRPDIFNS
jgi:DNA-binding transcriptional regulator YdaS (Cro superfamily)